MPTRRTALASVRNNTSDPLVGVSLVHKYSNNFKNQKQWGIILPGDIPSDSLEVEYNTGFLTTGRDWWLITWYSKDMKTLYYSNPNNLRDIIDKLEGVAPDAIAGAAGAIAGLGTTWTGPALVAAAAAAKVTTSALFNSESTAGFKQHILREEDEGALTEIVINADRTITFKSNSGNSDTMSASKPAPGVDGRNDIAPRHEPFCNQVEETCYPITNWEQGKTRGLALIVSMEKKRPGAAVDRGRLETVFRACGFAVQPLLDLEASTLVDRIKSAAEKDVLEEDECLVCSINAHGGTQDQEAYITDNNDDRVMVRDIVEPFQRSKRLRGKPKVFFVNCCRGKKLYDNSTVEGAEDDDHGAHDTNDEGTEDDDHGAYDTNDDQHGTGTQLPHLTEISDTLLVFSTSEGCPSCRSSMTGTLFVKKLVETVMEKRLSTDVLNMMTMVNKRVAEVQNPYEIVRGGTKTKVKVGQCCEVRHSLRKKLYWQSA